MLRDKQLRDIKFDDVLQKRRLDQALNAKAFAVLAGVSYSTAREWFRLPGFPVARGVLFWEDFVHWRRRQVGLRRLSTDTDRLVEIHNRAAQPSAKPPPTPRAARILAEATKPLIMNGAGEGNRTLASGLGSPHSTIEPHPLRASFKYAKPAKYASAKSQLEGLLELGQISRRLVRNQRHVLQSDTADARVVETGFHRDNMSRQ